MGHNFTCYKTKNDRKLIGHLSEIGRKFIGHRSEIDRTVIGNLSEICQNSIGHLSEIGPKPVNIGRIHAFRASSHQKRIPHHLVFFMRLIWSG